MCVLLFTTIGIFRVLGVRSSQKIGVSSRFSFFSYKNHVARKIPSFFLPYSSQEGREFTRPARPFFYTSPPPPPPFLLPLCGCSTGRPMVSQKAGQNWSVGNWRAILSSILFFHTSTRGVPSPGKKRHKIFLCFSMFRSRFYFFVYEKQRNTALNSLYYFCCP